MSILPSCQIKKLPFIYKEHPPDWLICWYKGSPGHVAYIGFNDWEPLLVYGKTDKLQMHDYFYAQPETNKRGHPCPKPIRYSAWIIERACPAGGIVFDPFMGSGTTGAAAKELNRDFIGVDISPEYCKIAEKRIFNTQESLF